MRRKDNKTRQCQPLRCWWMWVFSLPQQKTQQLSFNWKSKNGKREKKIENHIAMHCHRAVSLCKKKNDTTQHWSKKTYWNGHDTNQLYHIIFRFDFICLEIHEAFIYSIFSLFLLFFFSHFSHHFQFIRWLFPFRVWIEAASKKLKKKKIIFSPFEKYCSMYRTVPF